jgi:hypothetical protein
MRHVTIGEDEFDDEVDVSTPVRKNTRNKEIKSILR